MCVLCEREAAERLALQDSLIIGRNVLALGNAALHSHLLIDSVTSNFSRQLVASDGVMGLYLHAPGGAVQVSGGGFGRQMIQSVAIPQQDQDYIRSIVNRLEAIIDLDFDFVADPGQADVAFYYDVDIDIGGDGQTLGLATMGQRGWELFVNQPAVASDQDYRQYVNLHEWGHALGLEHPFEARDGDVHAGNINPWTSAYPEETVMAYRQPLSGDWPDFFSMNDLNALIDIWDAELRQLTMASDGFDGADYAEHVNGLAGDDRLRGLGGNDRLRGGGGNDWINGNWGDDVIIGDFGDDFMLGGRDSDHLDGGVGNDWLNGNMGVDFITGGLGRDILHGGKNDDWLDGGEGDDVYWGDLGADRFRISQGFDFVADFVVGSGDRVELPVGLGYRFEQVEDGLRVVTSVGTMQLNGVNLNSFDASTAIVFA